MTEDQAKRLKPGDLVFDSEWDCPGIVVEVETSFDSNSPWIEISWHHEESTHHADEMLGISKILGECEEYPDPAAFLRDRSECIDESERP